jgi:DNA polymerase V
MQTLDAICGVSATTGLLPTATGYAVVEANPGKLEQDALSFCLCMVVSSLLN